MSCKTDVARVTYRNLLIAFHSLTFSFIHSNPLRMELEVAVNDWVSPRELDESSFRSQRRVIGVVGRLAEQRKESFAFVLK